MERTRYPASTTYDTVSVNDDQDTSIVGSCLERTTVTVEGMCCNHFNAAQVGLVTEWETNILDFLPSDRSNEESGKEILESSAHFLEILSVCLFQN